MGKNGSLSPLDVAIITNFAYDFDEEKLRDIRFKIVPNSKEDILGTTAVFIVNDEKRILVRAGRGTDHIPTDFFRNWLPTGAIDAELLDTYKSREIIKKYTDKEYEFFDTGDSGAALSAYRSQGRSGSKLGITNSTQPLPYWMYSPLLMGLDLSNGMGTKDGIGVYSAGEILSTSGGYQNLRENYVVLTAEGAKYYQKLWGNENILKVFADPIEQQSYETGIRHTLGTDFFTQKSSQISIHMDGKALIENIKQGNILPANEFNGLSSFLAHTPEYIDAKLDPQRIFADVKLASQDIVSIDFGNGPSISLSIDEQYQYNVAIGKISQKYHENNSSSYDQGTQSVIIHWYGNQGGRVSDSTTGETLDFVNKNDNRYLNNPAYSVQSINSNYYSHQHEADHPGKIYLVPIEYAGGGILYRNAVNWEEIFWPNDVDEDRDRFRFLEKQMNPQWSFGVENESKKDREIIW